MFGICNLNIVPVRTSPSDKSELCTQLLFGDGYRIIEKSENKKWLKINIAFDDYEGWIDVLQHNQVSESIFESYILSDHKLCFDDIAFVDSNETSSLITLGSILPFAQGRKINIGDIQYQFQGELIDASPLSNDFIKFIALRYINAPYLWGGKTLFGIDCSGYVQQIFKLFGYKLKRDAYQQAEQGKEILLTEAKTGHLAFFENDLGKIIHVGMILEGNKIIHAHGKVRIDVVDEKGILNLTTKKYSHKLNRIKRIIDI